MLGKFIVFEGLDGSGLSTQAIMLRDYLVSKNKSVLLTKEQTDAMIGGLIKSFLRKEAKTSPEGLQLLFAADRAHHLVNEIEPALKEGKIVISDRYIFSTLAFGSLDGDMEFLKYINSKFRKPDLTFIIDTPPEVCLERIAKTRFHLELFEQKEKLEHVRKTYLSLKDYFPNVFIIDGNRRKEEVFESIRKIVDNKLRI
ncbi:MAG: dTMP kinase [Candidatus Aenigmatarchaeota archaeon]